MSQNALYLLNKTYIINLIKNSTLLHIRKNVTYRAIIQHGNHTQVFFILSNVTQFQTLNPTILSIDRWEKLNESEFYVEYTECLSQVPAVRNQAKAFYKVCQSEDGSYSLVSTHLTCFYSKYLCLTTNSVLNIRKLSSTQVGYAEQISYSCPWPLSKFCFHELEFQRKSITTNLNKIFSNTEKLRYIFTQNIH